MYARFASYNIAKSKSRIVRTRQISTTASKAREIKERKIKVNDMEINYGSVGTGDHPVLLLPGALGTIRTSFKPQLENLNVDKLTLVAWEPPGYGKSRPPDRTFPDDFYQRDATYAYNLMKILGYSKFSMIGWSNGGITSLVLASAYPESVHKLVVTGAHSYITQDETKIYESLRDINNWSENMRAPLMEVYGKDYFQKMWSDWTDTALRLYKTRNGNLCKQALPKIKCPTLIIHGARDPVVMLEHPMYLKQNIPDSTLYVFEEGAHTLHLRYPEKFNNLVTKFLVGQSKMHDSSIL